MSGEFVKALEIEMRQAHRDFWTENTAVLVAYGRGDMIPSVDDWAEAKRRVAQISDEDLMKAATSVAAADAKRCPECGRDYE